MKLLNEIKKILDDANTIPYKVGNYLAVHTQDMD